LDIWDNIKDDDTYLLVPGYKDMKVKIEKLIGWYE